MICIDLKHGLKAEPENSYPPRQVFHDSRQVLCPQDLVPGKQYVEMKTISESNRPSGLIFTVLSVGKPKGWFQARTKDGLVDQFSLADRGIISYGKFWNDTNYLLPFDVSTNKPIQLDKSKVHPRSFYLEVEYIDGACDDQSFAWFTYGPLNNLDEVKILRPLIEANHQLHDNRCYAMTHLIPGYSFYGDPKEIVSPQDFLKQIREESTDEPKLLRELKEAEQMFS